MDVGSGEECPFKRTIVEVKDTIYLKSYQTKGKSDQQVVVNETLRKEVGLYISKNKYLLNNRDGCLLRSQKTRQGFSSQTIQNLFRLLYKEANIENASSHSGRRSFITNLSELGRVSACNTGVSAS